MNRLLAVSLGLSVSVLLAKAAADPAADVDAAVNKLLGVPNFNWTVTWTHVDPSIRYRYEGSTEPLGMTVVWVNAHALPAAIIGLPGLAEEAPAKSGGDGPVVLVFAGERCVLRVDREWLTASEYRAMNTPAFSAARVLRAASGGVGATGSSVTTTTRGPQEVSRVTVRQEIWTTAGFVYLPRPDLILRIIRGELSDVKSSGSTVTARIGERAVRELFELRLAVPFVDWGRSGVSSGVARSTSRSSTPERFPDQPGVTKLETVETVSSSRAGPHPDRRDGVGNRDTRPGNRGSAFFQERYETPSGTVKFWIAADGLTKFELRLDSLGVWPGSRRIELPHEVTIVCEIAPGRVPMEIPAGASEKLRSF